MSEQLNLFEPIIEPIPTPRASRETFHLACLSTITETSTDEKRLAQLEQLQGDIHPITGETYRYIRYGKHYITCHAQRNGHIYFRMTDDHTHDTCLPNATRVLHWLRTTPPHPTKRG